MTAHNKYIIVVLLLIGQGRALLSQDTLQLPEVLVQDTYNKWTNDWDTLSNRSNFDGPILSESLSDLLQNESSVSLRKIGLGGLSTALANGSGSQHLSILWNGLNLQDITNGTYDLSLISASQFDQVQYTSSGNSHQSGEGSLGGALALQTKFRQTHGNTLKLGLMTGDIGQFGGDAHFSARRRGLAYVIHANVLDSSNRYRYNDRSSANSEEKKQEHNHVQRYNFSSSLRWQVNPQGFLSFHGWMQKADREIPSSIFQTEANTTQEDEAYRGVIDYVFAKGGNSFKVNAGYSTSDLIFESDVVQKSETRVNQFFTGLNWHFHSANRVFEGRVKVRQSQYKAISNQFDRSPTRSSSNALFSLVHHDSWARLVFNARLEFVENDWAPLIGALRLEKSIGLFNFDLNLARNYRLPTFNDLYWPQGGNEDLTVEKSYEQKFSVNYRPRSKRVNFNMAVDFLHRTTDDWIQWIPTPQLIWRPFNVRKVELWGINTKFTTRFRSGQTLFETYLSYSFTQAESKEVSVAVLRDQINRQLIYVPRHRSVFRQAIERRRWTLTTTISYTSRRFVTTDEKSFLSDYFLVNTALSYAWNTKGGFDYRIGVKAINVLNKDYALIVGYPMPLRRTEVQFTFKIDREKDN